MKAYNETWIRNKRIRELADRWKRRGILNSEQVSRIRDQFPVGFHDANGFIEIGLFVFAVVAIGGSYFLLATLLAKLFENSVVYYTFNIVFGLVAGLVGGSLINSRKFYRSGVDNALIAVCLALVTTGLLGFLPNHFPLWASCLVALPILLLGIWYYGDLLVTMAAFGTLVTALFDGLTDFEAGKNSFSFVLIGLSVVLYMTARRYEDRANLVYWRDCLILLEWLSLSLLLLNCNYYVIRRVHQFLLPHRPATPPELDMAGLFWTLTMLTPLVLAYLGIRQKERPLLIMSVIGWGAALATWRYYHSLLPVELYLTLNGLVIMLVAAALIRYLSRPRNGFTDAPDEDSPDVFLAAPEVISAIGGMPGQPEPKGMQFGQGDFGGGGSGDQYP